jgi:hypothetical protein
MNRATSDLIEALRARLGPHGVLTDPSDTAPYCEDWRRRTYPQPYANGGGPRVSSYSIPRSEHYQASPDYATDPALHPYSSGLGPRASSQGTVRAEHYQVPPDYDQNVAMHPYTSGHGPCPQGGAGKVVCTDMIPSSRHNR